MERRRLRAVCRQAFTVLVEAPEIMAARRQERRQRERVPRVKSPLKLREPDTWNLSGTQGNVFGNPRPMFDSSQTSYQGILHSTTPSATGAVPVQGSTGTLVAR